MCLSIFHVFIFIFVFSLMSFHPKLLWVHDMGGGGGVHLWAWPQGQKVTYIGPNSDIQWAKM